MSVCVIWQQYQSQNNSIVEGTRNKELVKHQGLKEELERMWKLVPLVIGALWDVTYQLREKLQQISRITLRPLARGAQSKEQLRYCTEPSGLVSSIRSWHKNG